MQDPRKTSIFESWARLQRRASIPGIGRPAGGWGGVKEHQGGCELPHGGSIWGWGGRRGELDGAAGPVAMGSDPTRLRRSLAMELGSAMTRGLRGSSLGHRFGWRTGGGSSSAASSERRRDRSISSSVSSIFSGRRGATMCQRIARGFI